MLAYHNGDFLPLDTVRISPLDPGFSGVALVDNARTFAGKLFRWRQHLERLRRDCNSCRVPLELSDAELTRVAEKLLDANGVAERDLHVITVVTPGPTVFMHTKGVNAVRYAPFFSAGVRLHSVVGASRSPLLSPAVKHRSRMLWHVAESQPRPGGTEVILASDEVGVLETSFANMFSVFRGEVFARHTGHVLAGVTAGFVVELCGRLGILCRTGMSRESSPERWEEAFLAGSGFGVAGVSEIDGVVVPWPGPVFQKIYAAFCDEVACDLAATLTPPPSCEPSRS